MLKIIASEKSKHFSSELTVCQLFLSLWSFLSHVIALLFFFNAVINSFSVIFVKFLNKS